MDESNKEQFEQRLSRLEEKVDRLYEELNKSRDEASVMVNTESSESDYQQESEYESQSVSSFDFGENWLNRIGIGLLLLGVLFLFKYSIDQGWLIPPVRSLIGLGIGLALFIPGLQMKDTGTPMKQLLLGGGIATFYITGFATFQLYSFLSEPVVWAFMIVVTLLALSLSLGQNQSILSVVGMLGGIGTPFMLYTGEGSMVGLIAYTSLVLAGGSIMYLYKGWRSLLWTMVVGGWAVLLVGYFENIFLVSGPLSSDLWSLQIGAIIYLLLLWVVPVTRRILYKKNPDGWSVYNQTEAGTGFASDPHVNLMALVLPIVTLIYSMGLWELTDEAWGVMAMSASLAIGYIYLPLKNQELNRLASTHGFTALILLTTSFFLLLDGDLLFVILALEALGLRIVAHNASDEKISISSHIIFGIVFYSLLDNFSAYPNTEMAVFNLTSLTNLLVIAIGGVAAPYWLKEHSSKLIYRLIAHLALLGWFLFEFSSLENGQAYVSVAWGLYAIGILIFGFIKDLNWLRIAGMGTIFLVVGKLFLIDLSKLDAIWRILLFMGFGAVFLMIGYYVQQKFSPENDTLAKPE
ncbi:MAG: DUF2339 domain-containing protein [Balneolaceae bacterium]|nr:DUF2339 domain-containing protein [Balneolaceae bacterium]